LQRQGREPFKGQGDFLYFHYTVKSRDFLTYISPKISRQIYFSTYFVAKLLFFLKNSAFEKIDKGEIIDGKYIVKAENPPEEDENGEEKAEDEKPEEKEETDSSDEGEEAEENE
jgi:hypothetical protein